MDLEVITFASYYTGDSWDNAQQETYAVNAFVKALKGQRLKSHQYADIPLELRRWRLTAANQSKVYDWFAEMVATTCTDEFDVDSDIIFIPVPGSKCTSVDDVMDSPTMQIANAIAQRVEDSSVLPVLRFARQMRSASKEYGPREPATLYRHLVLDDSDESIDAASMVVLVDDVITTGGHLQACRAVLHDHDITCKLALCVAQTSDTEAETPWSLKIQQLSEWMP